jgi:predicted protein tyrosine phosphatase
MNKVKLLFICSRNQWRSPTAEIVWRKDPRVLTRSAGTSPNAKHSVSLQDIQWADVILVMEEKHKARLCAHFPGPLTYKLIYVLDIPDDYAFMDAELIQLLRLAVEPILESLQSQSLSP